MLHHRISNIEEDTGRQAEKCERKIRQPECSDELEVVPSEEFGKEYVILFEEGVSSVLNCVNGYGCIFSAELCQQLCSCIFYLLFSYYSTFLQKCYFNIFEDLPLHIK
jgi:hypothetical protein